LTDRKWIRIRRMWHLSTARNMQLTSARPKFNTLASDMKKRNRLAVRDDQAVVK